MYWEFVVKPRGAPLVRPAHAIFLEMWAESHRIAFNLIKFNYETNCNIKYVTTENETKLCIL
jgi:hypothetical protein